jgi:hypothetical protein
MAKSEKKKEDIAKREGEIWEMETYYFVCPVCDKSYNIEYNASTRTEFDGKYEDNTCFIKKDRCRFCETKLSVAYDADRLGIVVYDTTEEKRWQELADAYSKEWNKLKKLKKELKKNETKELKEKKESLKKKCRKLEQEIIDTEEQYEEKCERQMIAREQEESVSF